jgi:hypothetical protein
MKQVIFGCVLALLSFGFFVDQAFDQVTGTNGGIAAAVRMPVTVELAQVLIRQLVKTVLMQMVITYEILQA